MVKQKAEDDIAMGSMRERLMILTDEVDWLRRHVHDLQQESADKEVKLSSLQLTWSGAQDKEDKEGLNIVLDSNQQELELRKLGVKGTEGSTPAPQDVVIREQESQMS
ncbi:hypothetical protein K439DRAFT_1623355 [Ramaria rubella]|nr:hypothetical protein K439DRAFT_1623355 [Ramaria rubella]